MYITLFRKSAKAGPKLTGNDVACHPRPGFGTLSVPLLWAPGRAHTTGVRSFWDTTRPDAVEIVEEPVVEAVPVPALSGAVSCPTTPPRKAVSSEAPNSSTPPCKTPRRELVGMLSAYGGGAGSSTPGSVATADEPAPIPRADIAPANNNNNCFIARYVCVHVAMFAAK